ncbi:FAD-binding domain-containing protein [Escherichia coli]
MSQLIDGDLAANNGGWQWAASTGTDAAPYFTVFSTRQLRARNLTAKANLSASGYRSCAMYRGKRCMSRGSRQRKQV